jgi:hypothetical protein
MYGDDGVLYQSMAQELLIRELEVPLVIEAPPWADKARRRSPRRSAGGNQDHEGERHGAT